MFNKDEFPEIGRCKKEIADCKQNVETGYAKLGKAYYDMHKEQPLEGLEAYVDMISENLSDIDRLEKELEDIAQFKKCPFCDNEDISERAIFCCICGRRIKELREQMLAYAMAPMDEEDCTEAPLEVVEEVEAVETQPEEASEPEGIDVPEENTKEEVLDEVAAEPCGAEEAESVPEAEEIPSEVEIPSETQTESLGGETTPIPVLTFDPPFPMDETEEAPAASAVEPEPEFVNCPACGRPVRREFAFCTGCGHKMR